MIHIPFANHSERQIFNLFYLILHLLITFTEFSCHSVVKNLMLLISATILISASKLEVADNALSIFENLKKGNKIHYENVDFLLECLWLMHRKDLIRKLGFVPEDVKPYMAHLNQVTPFR